MITLKSPHEIELMRRAGNITAAARALARDMVKPGVTTAQIDKAVFQFIKEQGATPSFLHYNGYPASVCVSVNDEIIHGIPGKRVLQEGDIVSVDVGAFIGGFHGDCAGNLPLWHSIGGALFQRTNQIVKAESLFKQALIQRIHAGTDFSFERSFQIVGQEDCDLAVGFLSHCLIHGIGTVIAFSNSIQYTFAQLRFYREIFIAAIQYPTDGRRRNTDFRCNFL